MSPDASNVAAHSESTACFWMTRSPQAHCNSVGSAMGSACDRPTGPAWASVRVSVVSRPWSCWKTAFLDLYGWSSGGGVADERKATTQAWRWGRDRAVLVKLTIRMARRVDKQHEGFVRAKARTKPTNRDND